MEQIGFVGTGTMGSAVARVMRRALTKSEASFIFSNRSPEKRQKLAAELEGTEGSNDDIAQHCAYIFLGVKPQMMAEVLGGMAERLKSRTDSFVLISMAAGLTVGQIQEMAGGDYPVIRMMPNTPLEVGAGVVQYCGTASEQQLERFGTWMSHGGVADLVAESMMDAAMAISGCGPAFCALLVEALADGGVLCGLPREKALFYAAQTLVGTGELLLQKEMHPAVLKDGVCSPAGTTIKGVAELEKNGFRSGAIQAVLAAYEGNKAFQK